MAREPNADGAREQIHVSGPSLVPLVTAAGITLALLGLITSWWFVAAGIAIVALAVGRWIRDVREDVASLPAERR